jgi:hypothetical protein
MNGKFFHVSTRMTPNMAQSGEPNSDGGKGSPAVRISS